MSWRHAEPRRTATRTRVREPLLFLNRGHLTRSERLEKTARGDEIELSISCLDAKEKPVPTRQGEAWHVEHGVVGHRQSVQREHAENSRERGSEDGALERDRDEGRPAVQRPAADVH